MIFLVRKLFLLFFCISSFQFFGQNEYRAQVLRYNDGLPSDVIQSTIISASGHLYVASQRGISMYDGYRFVNHFSVRSRITSFYSYKDTLYYHDFTGLNTLSTIFSEPETILETNFTDSDPNNDHFDNLFIDSKERIWGTDFNYIKYFLPKEKKTKTFLINAENKDLDLNISIFEPLENQIWVVAKNGLWVWKEATNKFALHPVNEINQLHYNTAFQIENKDVLLSAKDGRIFQIDPVTNTITDLPSLPFNEPAIGFRSINKKLLLYSSKRIYIQGENNKTYKEIYDAKGAHINHLSIDKKTGLIWVSTNKGLVKLTPLNQGIQILKISEQEHEDDPVMSILEDKNNALWVLTQSGEVWIFQNEEWKNIYKGEETTRYYALDKVQNKIILSTSDGLLEWKNNRFHLMDLPNLEIKSAIRKVLLTAQNELWILFSNQKIKRYRWTDLEEITRNFTNHESFWTENKWNDIAVDNNDAIWLVGWMPKGFGINKFNPVKQLFVDISDASFKNLKGDFVGDYYNRIGFASGNHLLFSAYGGWNKVDEDGNIVQKTDIHEYPIADSYIAGISEDKSQNVFFATAEGLHILLKEKDKVVRISQVDGLPTDYLANAYKPLANGTVAIGISNGILVVNPEKILETQLTNRLELTQIRVNGVLKKSNTTHIELSKKETDLTLYFSDLSFLDPYKINYRYRFEGEDFWHYLGSTPEISLNHIQPGKYKINIEVSDNIANVQEQKLDLYVRAHPPFTKSGLFYILVALLVISMIILTHIYLLNKQKKEEQYLRRIKDAEMQTLRSQMNPHFMFNTLNSINSYIIQNKTEDASAYLTTFSKLMRNILHNSKHQFISLENEIQTLKLYLQLESARLEHSFDYEILIEKAIDSQNTMIPPLIIQPFAENAIWHGLRNMPEKGKLLISVKNSKTGQIEISIQDNGIGRKKSMLLKTNQTHHKSYGIEITSERLKTLHPDNEIVFEDLYDQEGNPLGTKVSVTIILSEDD